MEKKLRGLFITGAQANSKSTLVTFIGKLVCSNSLKPSLLLTDMSDVIRWGRLFSSFKREIEDYEEMMQNGHYLPDPIAIPLFDQWIGIQVSKCPYIRTLVVSGFPRTRKQREYLPTKFDKEQLLIASVKIAPKQSWAMIKNRLEQTSPDERRPDDAGGSKVFVNRQTAFETHTVPMLESLNGDGLYLDWEDPLSERLEKLLDRLVALGTRSPIKRRLVRRAIGKLNDENHPVHIEVKEIEARPRPAPLEIPVSA